MADEFEKILFTTDYCARCPGIKQKLTDKGVEFTLVDAIKNKELVSKYGVRGVPSLVLLFEGEVHQVLVGKQLEEMLA